MKTLIHLLETSVSSFGDKDYMMDKVDGSYVGFTFNTMKVKIELFAAALMSLGIQKGDRLALISEGRHEWVVSEMGMIHAGAINVPLSVKLNPEEILFRVQHAGCKMIVVSRLQLRKLEGIHKNLDAKIIILDDLQTGAESMLGFQDLLQRGREYLKNNQASFIERKNAITENDVVNICYTSGTTADPKGIMLTHKNYVTNVAQASYLFPIPSHFVTLLILPWDHAFGHTAVVYTFMKRGACIASVDAGNSPMDTLKNIPINIKEVRPHLLCSVPALAKNFKKNIENGIRAKGAITEILFRVSLKIAYIYNASGFNKGKGLRFFLKPLYALFDKIIFSKIRDGFGGRLEYFVGGGALLNIELQRFFAAIGIPMMQGYGLTEASPIISANALRKHKFGTSGILVDQMELKICDEEGHEVLSGSKGEIVIRGENIMAGYWKNPQTTSQTIVDGWLHTGDMGLLDLDGFLYVYGRFNSLLISDDGEKYSPEDIEEAIAGNSPYIEQCLLYNMQNPYTVAIVVPNKEGIRRYLKSHHIDPASDGALQESLILIENEIKEYRPGKKYGDLFPQRWVPSAIGIIDEAFTEDNLLLNSTLKIVRGKIVAKYSERIKHLYNIEAKNTLNAQNFKAMQKLLS